MFEQKTTLAKETFDAGPLPETETPVFFVILNDATRHGGIIVKSDGLSCKMVDIEGWRWPTPDELEAATRLSAKSDLAHQAARDVIVKLHEELNAFNSAAIDAKLPGAKVRLLVHLDRPDDEAVATTASGMDPNFLRLCKSLLVDLRRRMEEK